MKLELKHICGYLPYGLKDLSTFDGRTLIRDVTIYNCMNHVNNEVFSKIILRPLTDLTKEIEHNGEKFVPIDILGDLIYEKRMGYNDHYINYEDLSKTGIINWLNEPYFIVDQLIEWHFDVFSLIDNGLAVDVNTLKDNPYA